MAGSTVLQQAEATIMGYLIVLALVLSLAVSFIFVDTVRTYLTSDAALMLAFIVPLLMAVLIYAMQTQSMMQLLGPLGNVLFFAVIPPATCLMMFLVILALPPGGPEEGVTGFLKWGVLLAMVLPFVLNHFVVVDLLIRFSSHYSGVIIFFIPVFYLVFGILGAIVGAVLFFIFG